MLRFSAVGFWNGFPTSIILSLYWSGTAEAFQGYSRDADVHLTANSYVPYTEDSGTTIVCKTKATTKLLPGGGRITLTVADLCKTRDASGESPLRTVCAFLWLRR